MVKASDIVDHDTLRAWLEGQPREVSIAIAARVVLRVLPFWVDFSARKWGAGSTTVLDALRAGMVCANIHRYTPVGLSAFALDLAGQVQASANFDGDVAAIHRAHADGRVANEVSSYAVHGSSLGFMIALAMDRDIRLRRMALLISQVFASFRFEEHEKGLPMGHLKPGVISRASFWSEVQRDIRAVMEGGGAGSLSLFKQPRNAFEFWQVVRSRKFEKEEWFGFWYDWYSGLINGEHTLDSEFQDSIVRLTDETWDRADDVAAEIARLREEFRKGTSRRGADVSGAPDVIENPSTIEQMLKTLRVYLDEKRRAFQGHNFIEDARRVQHDDIIRLFEDMITRVDAMLREFEGGVASSNALTVVQEQVPAILDQAAKLEDQGEAEEAPAYITHFATTVSVMTEKNVPGIVASGIAGFDTLIAKPYRNWKKKPKKSESRA